ncbi:MAG: hypothetical protein O8C64_16245 [Candidatus Methanoperedens sp.]|nr:hypothetical protein [Candidatus Methanoperedens sp.]MCZ7406121.1 hypothetical protein [Candidatus Methanoperedens sp.]
MKKTIVVAIFITAIMATVAIPSFAADVGYNATVAGGQNTFVVATNGNFGTILVGQSKIINNSVTLNNTGDVNATVDARFNDGIGGVYGLVSGSNVLPAGNFSLGNAPITWTALDNNGNDTRVAIAPGYGTITILDAKLDVPSTQPGGAYNGTVVLTFGNQV